jgi:hypothetical protein
MQKTPPKSINKWMIELDPIIDIANRIAKRANLSGNIYSIGTQQIILLAKRARRMNVYLDISDAEVINGTKSMLPEKHIPSQMEFAIGAYLIFNRKNGFIDNDACTSIFNSVRARLKLENVYE